MAVTATQDLTESTDGTPAVVRQGVQSALRTLQLWSELARVPGSAPSGPAERRLQTALERQREDVEELVTAHRRLTGRD